MTSALKRGRATLMSKRRPERQPPPLPNSAAERELVERFTRAFENHDVNAVVALLTEDVMVTMPPFPAEYQGPVDASKFLHAVFVWQGPPPRLVPTRANGQPAFGIYIRDPHAETMHAVGLLALTLTGDRICAMTRFDIGVMDQFHLSRTIRD